MLSTSANATFSLCQTSSKMLNVSSGTAEKGSISNVMERLRGNVTSEAESCLDKSVVTEKFGERAISGSGDASLIMKTCKRLNNVRLSNSKIQKSTSK